MEGSDGSAKSTGPLISNQSELETYASAPDRSTPLSAEKRGVLAEIALKGTVRYDWQLLKPLCHNLVDSVLSAYAAEEQEQHQAEVGPPPLPGGKPLDSLCQGLHDLLDSFSETPFTVQRLCEILLEPKVQYKKLDKLTAAIEKLLLVTSTIPITPELPPRPSLASLAAVNANPSSPYMPCNNSFGAQQSMQFENGPQSSSQIKRADDSSTNAVFSMFIHTGAVNGTESKEIAGIGSEAASTSSEIGAGDRENSAEDAVQAKAFVEAALQDESQRGSDPQVVKPAHGSITATASPASDEN